MHEVSIYSTDEVGRGWGGSLHPALLYSLLTHVSTSAAMIHPCERTLKIVNGT